MNEVRILRKILTTLHVKTVDVLLSQLLEQKEPEVLFLQRAEVIEVMNIQMELT